MLALLGMFTSLALVIPARSYDAGALWATLRPPDTCPAPCFMGIRPGITGAREALSLLYGHEWATRVADHTSYAITTDPVPSGLAGEILWQWSGQQPAWIDASINGRLWVSRSVVQSVYVSTRLRLGDIRLGLGTPDLEVVLFDASRRQINYRAGYSAAAMIFISGRLCPARDFWHTMVSIRVVNEVAALPRSSGRRSVYTGCYDR
jgi:hypothetical protein